MIPADTALDWGKPVRNATSQLVPCRTNRPWTCNKTKPKNDTAHAKQGLLDKPNALCSWEAYYRARGLSLSSPAALLLSFPLSLYHVVTRYGDVAAGRARAECRPFRIHLIGCEKELHLGKQKE